MPHGTPDWGLVGPKRTTYGLDDLGEHAVRLGSPHLWDRRGDVFYSSDFRNGFEGIRQSTTLAACTVGLSTGHTRQGAYSVVIGSDGVAGCTHGVIIDLPLPVRSGVGCEFSFCWQVDSERWRVNIIWSDRNRSYEARVRYHPDTRTVEWWGGLGVWTEFGTGAVLWPSDQPEHTMKLVVDIDKIEYVRFILDDLSWPMKGLVPRDAGGAAVSRLRTSALCDRQAGDDYDLYIDNFIVTQNEP